MKELNRAHLRECIPDLDLASPEELALGLGRALNHVREVLAGQAASTAPIKAAPNAPAQQAALYAIERGLYVRRFMEAARGIPSGKVAKIISRAWYGVDYSGCGKKHIAEGIFDRAFKWNTKHPEKTEQCIAALRAEQY